MNCICAISKPDLKLFAKNYCIFSNVDNTCSKEAVQVVSQCADQLTDQDLEMAKVGNVVKSYLTLNTNIAWMKNQI
jgi:hypothetical protein